MRTRDETFTIISSSGAELFIVVKTPAQCIPGRLAFLAHGLNDVHDSAPMRAMARGFFDAGYRVVLWDATNSRGRSGGRLEDVTITQYGSDLRSVVAWAREQPWYVQPFVLAGHSLGGGAVGEYAAAHPEAVSRLVLLAPVVAGKFVMRRIHPALLLWWRMRGVAGHPRTPEERYNWEFMRNLSRFNLLPFAAKLTMPVLIVVGNRDPLTPASDAMKLYLRLHTGRRKVAIIWGGKHRFDGRRAQDDVARRIGTWLGRP